MYNNNNDFEIESKYHRKIVVLFFSSNLEFTGCCFSKCVFSYSFRSFKGITKAARSAGGILPDGGIYLQDEPVITRARGDEETGNQSSGDQPVQSYKSAVVQLRTSLQIDRVRQRLQQEKALAIGNSSTVPLQVRRYTFQVVRIQTTTT